MAIAKRSAIIQPSSEGKPTVELKLDGPQGPRRKARMTETSPGFLFVRSETVRKKQIHMHPSSSGKDARLSIEKQGFDSLWVCQDNMSGWQSGNAPDCKSEARVGTGGSNPSPLTRFETGRSFPGFGSKIDADVAQEVERDPSKFHAAGSIPAVRSSLVVTRSYRRVAQPGRATALGAEGRRFKSSHADQFACAGVLPSGAAPDF